MAHRTPLPGSPRVDTAGCLPLARPVRRGPWVGTVNGDVECYYGIRYARLSDPGRPCSPAVSASGQAEAAEMVQVPVFPQLPSRLESVTGTAGRLNPQDDAAFFLNVWMPREAEGLPVVVFVHGGAWASGGGAMQWYRGQRLAQEGLVVVTLNYRLGPGGHLDDGPHAPSHAPFGDLLLALRWVRDHIADMGGDPGRVTLAGQSAGAWYAWALASLPQAKGLLRQAALLSIPCIRPWTPQERMRFTQQVLALSDGEDGATVRERLLRAGARALAQMPRIAGAMPPMYMPMLTGGAAACLHSAASAAAAMHADALYVRVTRHEMSVFLPDDAPDSDAAAATLQQLRARTGKDEAEHRPAPAHWDARYAEAVQRSSWLEFIGFADKIASAVASHGHPVVWREFAGIGGPPRFGAVHCMDLPFQFGNRADWTDAPMLAGWSHDAFEALSAEVRSDLAEFARGRHGPARRVLGDSAPVPAPT